MASVVNCVSQHYPPNLKLQGVSLYRQARNICHRAFFGEQNQPAHTVAMPVVYDLCINNRRVGDVAAYEHVSSAEMWNSDERDVLEKLRPTVKLFISGNIHRLVSVRKGNGGIVLFFDKAGVCAKFMHKCSDPMKRAIAKYANCKGVIPSELKGNILFMQKATCDAHDLILRMCNTSPLYDPGSKHVHDTFCSFILLAVQAMQDANTVYTDFKAENVLARGKWPNYTFYLGDIESMRDNIGEAAYEPGMRYFITYSPFEDALKRRSDFFLITCFAACCTAIEMANAFAENPSGEVSMHWADEKIQTATLHEHPLFQKACSNLYAMPWIDAAKKLAEYENNAQENTAKIVGVIEEAVTKTHRLKAL